MTKILFQASVCRVISYTMSGVFAMGRVCARPSPLLGIKPQVKRAEVPLFDLDLF